MGRLSMGGSLTGPKVPGREEVVNDGPKAALSPGPGDRLRRRQLGPRGAWDRVRGATSLGVCP
jgi:hypothetical protein